MKLVVEQSSLVQKSYSLWQLVAVAAAVVLVKPPPCPQQHCVPLGYLTAVRMYLIILHKDSML